jgi:putative nucleotidyltransferase with HDIG domain
MYAVSSSMMVPRSALRVVREVVAERLQHEAIELPVVDGVVDEMVAVAAWESAIRRATSRDDAVRDDLRLAVTSAVYAQEIAVAVRVSVDHAFLAALLHDIGRPVVREAVRDVARELGVDLSSKEEEALADELHPEVGAQLALDGDLPWEVAQGILHHHWPLRAPEGRKLAALVAIADACARFAQGLVSKAELLRNPALVLLGLGTDDLEEIVARAR